MSEDAHQIWPACQCCGELPAVCRDNDFGPICGDCAHDLALATVMLIVTPGIAPRVSTEADR